MGMRVGGRLVVWLALAAMGGASAAAYASTSGHATDGRAAGPPSKCINASPTQRGRLIFPELKTLGVRVWSSGISWASIAKRRPSNPRSPDDTAYVWPAGLDHELDTAVADGIEPVLYVNGFPSWSNGGRDATWAPKNPADYADFMAAAVQRYPQVRRWIVFSEPGNYSNFQPQGGRGKTAPRIYAKLLDAAYGAMHSVRHNVVVIGGNVHPAGFNDRTTTAPDTFLRYLVLPNGKRPRLDMFGINPYTERPMNVALPHLPGRVDFDDLDWLLKELDRDYSGKHLQLFIDEFGWNTEHSAIGWLYYVSRRQQAAKLAKAYRLAKTLRRVNTMCWFLLYDTPPQKQGSQWLNWTSGLRTSNGPRKPAWLAFRRVPSGPSRR
jgi:hypothetical protein